MKRSEQHPRDHIQSCTVQENTPLKLSYSEGFMLIQHWLLLCERRFLSVSLYRKLSRDINIWNAQTDSQQYFTNHIKFIVNCNQVNPWLSLNCQQVNLFIPCCCVILGNTGNVTSLLNVVLKWRQPPNHFYFVFISTRPSRLSRQWNPSFITGLLCPASNAWSLLQSEMRRRAAVMGAWRGSASVNPHKWMYLCLHQSHEPGKLVYTMLNNILETRQQRWG